MKEEVNIPSWQAPLEAGVTLSTWLLLCPENWLIWEEPIPSMSQDRGGLGQTGLQYIVTMTEQYRGLSISGVLVSAKPEHHLVLTKAP